MSASAEPGDGAPGPEAEYFKALDRGEFLLQRCGACARHVFYPRILCPHCGASALVWKRASGLGVVYSATIVRRRPEEGGAHNIVLIELEEGVRVMSRIDGAGASKIEIGMPVKAKIVVEDGHGVVVFEPSEGNS